ncbi:MAG TPA: hypothetical protein VIK52_14230 [Opitutaceae bacterium]
MSQDQESSSFARQYARHMHEGPFFAIDHIPGPPPPVAAEVGRLYLRVRELEAQARTREELTHADRRATLKIIRTWVQEGMPVPSVPRDLGIAEYEVVQIRARMVREFKRNERESRKAARAATTKSKR